MINAHTNQLVQPDIHVDGNDSRELLFFYHLKEKKGQMEFIHISAWNPNDSLGPIESPNDRAPLSLNGSVASHFLPTPLQVGGIKERQKERDSPQQ